MSNLDTALELAERGFTPLILSPLTKYPKYRDYFASATRDADAIAERYRETVEYAEWIESHRASDFARFRDPETGEFKPNATAAKAASQVEDYTEYEPNVGLYIGASGLAVIDVDSPAEYDAWMVTCEAHGFDPGTPTVQSPGAFRNGEWVHSDGGHWHYLSGTLTETLREYPSLSNARFTAEGFVADKDAKGVKLPAFMTNRRLVVVPPSQRAEGFYNGDLSNIPPLPQFLIDMVNVHVEREREQQSRRPQRKGADDPALIEWEAGLDVTDLLDGWEVSGTDSGCEVLEHPEASTSRSAVVHEPRCRHHQADTDHRLVTFHSVTRPDWVENALNGRTSCSVATLYAHKHFDGSAAAMKRALGFHVRHQSTSKPAYQAEPPEQAHRVVTTMVLSRPRRTSQPLSVTAEPQASTVSATTTLEVVSPAVESEPVVAPPQVEKVEPPQEITEDTWTPSVYKGDAPEWRGVNPMSTLYSLVAAIAVEPPTSTLTHLANSLTELSNPAPLRATEEQSKDFNIGNWRVRTNLHERHRIVTTDQLAAKLGVPSHRVRLWMRALIPVAASRGLIIRERVNERLTKERARTWNASNPDSRCLDYGLPTASADTAWLIFRVPLSKEN